MLREGKATNRAMSDNDAIERLKNGDPTGFAKLHDLYKARIYSLCLRYAENVFDAEDLTQDVFIQLFRKIHTFRGDAQFGSWLYKVALNTVRLHARRQRRLRRFIPADDSEEILSSAQSLFRNPAHNIALKQALSKLTPIRRETLLLHDIQGLTHNEVASRMGVTAVASKARLHQAHVALRNTFGSRSAALSQF